MSCRCAELAIVVGAARPDAPPARHAIVWMLPRAPPDTARKRRCRRLQPVLRITFPKRNQIRGQSHKKEKICVFITPFSVYLERVRNYRVLNSTNRLAFSVFSSLHGTSTGYTVFPEFKKPTTKEGNRTHIEHGGQGARQRAWAIAAGVCRCWPCRPSIGGLPNRQRFNKHKHKHNRASAHDLVRGNTRQGV